jgi:hypothetical protein
MKYYSIHYAIKKIGRGGFPQAQNIEMEPGRKVTDRDFAWELRADLLPDFKPYIGTLVLQNGSTLTDFISSATISMGFICNEKVKKIIEKHNFDKLRFYELIIKHKGIYHNNFYLMHNVNSYTNNIDFPNSKFNIYKIENNKWLAEKIKIVDFSQYKELSEKMRRNKYGDWQKIEAEEIKFVNDFKIMHDIFNLFGVNSKTYISDNIKTEFEKNKITGIQYNLDEITTEFK